jgi:hypothetical protein
MSNTQIVAILLTDCGIYDAEIAPAWHHVLLGTRSEDGLFMVKGSTLIANSCQDAKGGDTGWDADNEYALGAHMYVVLNENVVYDNLKLLTDSVYEASNMGGKEVQGFHIDAVLGGPEGYAITGTALNVHQPKFECDAALYLWEADQVEVLPVATTH